MTHTRAFDEFFRGQFDGLFASLFRYLDRLTGDSDLASDLAQESLLRLYERGGMPDDVRAWLVTVAHNQLRSHGRQTRRRGELLRLHASMDASDAPPLASAGVEAEDARRQVRAALDNLTMRDRQLLLLRAQGYSYRELAGILGLTETSVGTMLARAKAAFARSVGEE